MNRTGGHLRRIVSVLALLTTSCNGSTPGQPVTAQPPQPWTGRMADVRAVWSAQPGIDLENGPAVVVRAYVESYTLAMAMGDMAVVYPGFTRAVIPKEIDTSRKTVPSNPWPEIHPIDGYPPIVGTDNYRILRIDRADTQAAAVICNYYYTFGVRLEDGGYGRPDGPDLGGVHVRRISMTDESSSGDRLPPQHGPASAPVTDVFGEWRITGNWLFLEGEPAARTATEWPTVESDQQACNDQAPDPLERRRFLSRHSHPRSDYPTLAPSPGWPLREHP